MRREDLYLYDIVEAVNAIAHFLAGVTWEKFLVDDLIQSAVLQKLLIIGESAARLSEDFKARNHEIPWRDIVGFRNIAIHAYFAVDWKIVWKAATMDAPLLGQRIADVLAKVYPETYRMLQERKR